MTEKDKRPVFVIPRLKEAKTIKTTISDAAYQRIETEAREKEIPPSEVVRHIIYDHYERKQQRQSKKQ